MSLSLVSSPSPAADPASSGRGGALAIASVWAALATLGAVAVVPYSIAILPAATRAELPPLPALMAVSGAQAGALAFALALAGVHAGHALGLGSPIVAALVARRRPEGTRALLVAALAGVLSALAIIAAEAMFRPHMPPFIGGAPPRPPPISGLLASLYGGFTEEVMLRLGLLSGVAWIASRALGTEGRGRAIALAIGVASAALLFGAGHLPAAAKVWSLDLVVVSRTLLLNGVLGIVAGVLYVRRGFEHAVAAHLAADLVLHALLPALER